MRLRQAVVTEVLGRRPGLQRVRITLIDEPELSRRAYVITQLCAEVGVGERVLANTTAVDLGLGTGGWDVVVCSLDAPDLDDPGDDHIMKLRYTPLQRDVGTDELRYPAEADAPLDGAVVVVASLHSLAGAVALAVRGGAPQARIAYVMTDGAALTLALSDMVATLRAEEVLCGTVTAGQAIGGELEAVGVASALGLARHVLRADITIVAMGPGVVGTGTALGTSALEVAPILDLVARLGGQAVFCPRISNGDPRDRHLGLSHHSRRALELCWSRPVMADVSDLMSTEDSELVAERAEIVTVEDLDMRAALDASSARITTMGRDIEGDPDFFEAAARTASLAISLAL